MEKLNIKTDLFDMRFEDDIREALLKKMERAGFICISMGIESIKDETLSLYKKGLNMKKIEAGLEVLNQTNILTQNFFDIPTCRSS